MPANKTLRGRQSTVFLILFSVIYLLWATGKFSSWQHPHFDLFLLVFSLLFGLWVLHTGANRKKFWTWSSVFFILLMLPYAIWFPKTIVRWLPLCVRLLILIPVLFFTFHILHKTTDSKEVRIFQFVLIGYVLLLTLSTLMHSFSLQQLDPTRYVTVRRHTVNFALTSLDYSLNAYFFFPILLLLTVRLFVSDFFLYKRLYLLPIILIPSVAIAIYQAYVGMDFLNVPFFAKINRASGLGYDPNSFAFTLYLIFPLTVLNVILSQGCWKKLTFSFLAAILMWCLFLSGSRTAFLGVIVFLMVLPWIWVWASENLSKDRRRFLIWCPFIFAVSIGAIGAVSLQMNLHPSSTLGKRLLSSYHNFKRGGMKRVIDESSRSHLWLQAYRLTKEAPLSGWGPGGFKRNLDNTRFKYGENPNLKYIDFANNYYLHLTSDIGIFGAFLNVFFILFPLWMVFRIRKHIINREQRWAVGIAFSTIIIMMLLFITGPWTMVGLDALWVFVIILGFLFATGIRYGYSFDTVKMKWVFIAFVLCISIFVLKTYDHTFGRCGYKAMQDAEWWPLKYERNCYATEYWGGRKIRWCGKDAFLQVPIRKSIPDKVWLTFFIKHPDIETRPLTLRYGGKKGVTHELVIRDISWKTITIPMTSDYIYEFNPPNKPVQKYFVVCLDVSRTWTPKNFGINNDSRALGVAVAIPNL